MSPLSTSPADRPTDQPADQPADHASAHTADLVVFGGTGDLSMRKLIPALYHCDRDGRLSHESRIIAMSRGGLTDADFRGKVDAEVRDQVPADDQAGWQRFLGRLHHVSVDVGAGTGRDAGGADGAGWGALTALLAGHEQRDRVFYLASPPRTFGPFCRELDQAGLVTPRSRVVLEKPLGHDLPSAQRINDEVGAIFDEHQIFRIDHYLGKETVQNLLVLRFANAFLEPIWNSLWIDHVQITAAETVGTPGRRGYYDHAGALRDMVQNHLLQLLTLTAMEPPARSDREAVRDEKVKVLQALRPITGTEVDRFTVRGQYVGADGMPGYLDEPASTPPTEASRRVETFTAIRAEVKNWRWAGVPFYLRTGKRMPYRRSEIVVQFKDVPHSIYPGGAPNRLVLRLQPEEGIRLHIMAKEPGAGEVTPKPVPLSLSFGETFTTRVPEAYERLLTDVLAGNPTLFMRRDEVEAAWRWIDPILHAWESQADVPEPYPAGTTGPAGAHELLGRSGRAWHEEDA
ncbi:glucose-6-phosphate dehydrogenase [Nonomuraea sp. KM88]|uniref:glucose-6-phosphate dehydrogenase n=1 Tax=Nonomuraea sp. KM88 TaxID=3457427 RepID=UPI003FCD925A